MAFNKTLLQVNVHTWYTYIYFNVYYFKMECSNDGLVVLILVKIKTQVFSSNYT